MDQVKETFLFFLQTNLVLKTFLNSSKSFLGLSKDLNKKRAFNFVDSREAPQLQSPLPVLSSLLKIGLIDWSIGWPINQSKNRKGWMWPANGTWNKANNFAEVYPPSFTSFSERFYIYQGKPAGGSMSNFEVGHALRSNTTGEGSVFRWLPVVVYFSMWRSKDAAFRQFS